MKKAFLFLIIAAMIVTLCAVCVSAADPSLKLTKTVYAEGEEVIAIASGDGRPRRADYGAHSRGFRRVYHFQKEKVTQIRVG